MRPSAPSDTPPPHCARCGGAGHSAPQCTQAAVCAKCGERGHVAELCELVGKRKGPSSPEQPAKRANPNFVCRRCGRHGHLGRHCTYVEQKCSVCGEAGHFAKDCKGRGASFFLKASKALEGKQFAQAQAAMREAEENKAYRQEVFQRLFSQSGDAASGPGGIAKPTDFLLGGGKGSGKAKKTAIPVMVVGGQRAGQADSRQASAAAAEPTVTAAEPAESEEGEEEGAGGLFAHYESDSDAASELEMRAGEEASEQVGARGGAAELALPSAADLLGAGPDDATGGSSFLGGSKLCDNGAWEGHRDMQAQVSAAQRRKQLEGVHQVLEVRRSGGSVHGEEISVRVTPAAGACLGRALWAVRKATGAQVAEAATPEGVTFTIRRRQGGSGGGCGGDASVRAAAALLQGGVAAYLDMAAAASPGARSGGAGDTRTMDSVTFSYP